jgi:hypothetical protein
MPAECAIDAGNKGVLILADTVLPPRKHGVLISRASVPCAIARLREVLPLEGWARLRESALAGCAFLRSREDHSPRWSRPAS